MSTDSAAAAPQMLTRDEAPIPPADCEAPVALKAGIADTSQDSFTTARQSTRSGQSGLPEAEHAPNGHSARNCFGSLITVICRYLSGLFFGIPVAIVYGYRHCKGTPQKHWSDLDRWEKATFIVGLVSGIAAVLGAVFGYPHKETSLDISVSAHTSYCLNNNATFCDGSASSSPLNGNPVYLKARVRKDGEKMKTGLSFDYFTASSHQPPKFFTICDSKPCRDKYASSSERGIYRLFLVPDTDDETLPGKWALGDYSTNLKYEEKRFKLSTVGQAEFRFNIKQDPTPVDLLIKGVYSAPDFMVNATPDPDDPYNDGMVFGIEPSEGSTVFQLQVGTQKVFGPVGSLYGYQDVKLACPLKVGTVTFTTDDIVDTQINDVSAALWLDSDLSLVDTPPTRARFEMLVQGRNRLIVYHYSLHAAWRFILWEFPAEVITSNKYCIDFGRIYDGGNCDTAQEPTTLCT